MIVSRGMPEKCPEVRMYTLYSDEDTLDTWFSSALWPFSVLGWPDKTEEMDYFYPTDVLVTGYDIIFSGLSVWYSPAMNTPEKVRSTPYLSTVW